MSNNVSLQEAKEGLESLGMWMESRYHIHFLEVPIQKWDMPRKEKGFFTVYAMNLALESDGFNCLVGQKPEDVEAFIDMLYRLGAKKTSAFVQSTLTELRSKTVSDENKSTSEYYGLYEREKVWLRLLDYVGRRIHKRYVLRAQAIDNAGKNIFDPKEWQGDVSETPGARFLQIVGIALLVLGVLFSVDGLLPLRSQGPNPSWMEVAIGTILFVIGWAVQRITRD